MSGDPEARERKRSKTDENGCICFEKTKHYIKVNGHEILISEVIKQLKNQDTNLNITPFDDMSEKLKDEYYNSSISKGKILLGRDIKNSKYVVYDSKKNVNTLYNHGNKVDEFIDAITKSINEGYTFNEFDIVKLRQLKSDLENPSLNYPNKENLINKLGNLLTNLNHKSGGSFFTTRRVVKPTKVAKAAKAAKTAKPKAAKAAKAAKPIKAIKVRKPTKTLKIKK